MVSGPPEQHIDLEKSHPGPPLPRQALGIVLTIPLVTAPLLLISMKMVHLPPLICFRSLFILIKNFIKRLMITLSKSFTQYSHIIYRCTYLK